MESLGTMLTKTHEKGGLDFGTKGSSLILFAILAVLIVVAIRNINAEEKTKLA